MATLEKHVNEQPIARTVMSAFGTLLVVPSVWSDHPQESGKIFHTLMNFCLDNRNKVPCVYSPLPPPFLPPHPLSLPSNFRIILRPFHHYIYILTLPRVGLQVRRAAQSALEELLEHQVVQLGPRNPDDTLPPLTAAKRQAQEMLSRLTSRLSEVSPFARSSRQLPWRSVTRSVDLHRESCSPIALATQSQTSRHAAFFLCMQFALGIIREHTLKAKGTLHTLHLLRRTLPFFFRQQVRRGLSLL